jgi:hypothetical protein
MLCCLHLKRQQSGSWLCNSDIDILIFRHRFCIVSMKFPEFKRVQKFAKKIWTLKNRKCKITKLNAILWNYLSSNKHESKWNFFECIMWATHCYDITGSMISNGREPKRCLCYIFKSKLGCIVKYCMASASHTNGIF